MEPFGGFGAFNFMFSLFPIFFIFVFGMIVFTVIRGIKEWHNNNQQPVLSVPAVVVTKRSHTSRSAHNHGDHTHHSTSTTYYTTFEVESGDRMEFRVSAQEYGMLAEGDVGKLTFQGSRYHSFDRKKSSQE
ncbi:Protein of unknown function [Geosporobacter subterraneus DSM 17957]|uniref:DUF2500 domain-containing protein n=1 Tax=Geosporobacter subterraneus DSM 17957 TaxID=1121919 RepID=A0A1M6BZC8_9FIRM|nr:DUF2500 domain-containing protein [Geosporobacter subterraneus]SHI53941.1 Protein of unknown function [Geosporobacter subterraneus DSM 17957]